MEFTLAFGAVGDFIAVIALIKDIITALDDSRGSAKDYRDIVHSLEILQRTVEQVSKIYNDHGVAKDLSDLRILAMNSAGRIQQELEAFRDRNRKYGNSLGAGVKRNVLRDAVRKIQWSFEEKDVMKFRDEMKGYTVSLSMLLDVTTIRLMQRNHEARITQATENEDRIAITIRRSSQMLKQYVGAIGQRILSKLDFMTGLSLDLRKSSSDLMAMMVSLSGELSGIKNILMRLERPLNDEHFILEDITGRVFPIHLKTITSWEAFEFILADRFRGKRGAHRVKGKQYSLQERATHRQIDRAIDWEGAFLPYQRIDMSLLCREAQGGSPKRSCVSCPWCQTVSSKQSDEETQCRKCNMFFRRVVENDDAEVQLKDALSLRPPTTPAISRNLGIRFGEPSLRPEKRKISDEESASDASGPHRAAKQRIRQSDSSKKSMADKGHSDSDDEDVRGFVRITLISKRRRRRWFTSDQMETFNSLAQRFLQTDSSPRTATLTPRTQTPHPARADPLTYNAAGPGQPFSRLGMPAISIQDGAAGDIEANSDSGDKLSKDSNVFALPFPLAFQPTAISRFGNASANASNTRKWARRKRVRSIDWNPFPDPPAPASNIGVTDDSGDESTNDVDIFERFQRHRSPSCSPTPASERPHLPMYDKDLQAGSIELGIYNIPQHLSTSTWNKHRKPVVFLGQVFDCDSLARWILECLNYARTCSERTTFAAYKVSEMLLDMGKDVEFLKEAAGSFTSSQENERIDLLLDMANQLTLVQCAIRGCENSLGFDGILGQYHENDPMSNLHSGTALSIALVYDSIVLQDSGRRWRWTEFDNAQFKLAIRVDKLKRSRRRSSKSPQSDIPFTL